MRRKKDVRKKKIGIKGYRMTGLRMPNLTQRHDCEASKLSKARIDLFILGVDNLDAKRQGQY